MSKPEKTKKVQKPNNQIELKYGFSAPELDVLDIIICQAKSAPSTDEFRICKIDTGKYVGLFLNNKGEPLTKRQIHMHLCRGVERLWDKEISIQSGKKTLVMRILSAKAIDMENGIMQIHIAPEFGGLLQKQIDEYGYTLYDLRYQLALTDKYAKRLYPMLQRYAKTGVRFDKAEDLREKLGIPPSVRQHEFVNYVERALCQINNYTDLCANIENMLRKNISGGSRIEQITFSITKKDGNHMVGLSEQQKQCISYAEDLFRGMIDEKTAFLLSAEAGYDMAKIDDAKSIMESYGKDIENVAGFLLSAVQMNWDKGAKKRKKSSFHNFTDMEYTEEDYLNIERMLLQA